MSEAGSGTKSAASILYAKWQASNITPTLVKLLLKWGVVKTRKQANQLLLAVVVIAFGLSVYFFFFSEPSGLRVGYGPQEFYNNSIINKK